MFVQGSLEIEDGQLKNEPDVSQVVAKALEARLARGLLVVGKVQRKSVELKALNVVPIYDAPQHPGDPR